MKKMAILALTLGICAPTITLSNEASNIEQAIKWYSMAAESGHAGAQNNLGSIYFNGVAGEKDYQKSYDLFSAAAAQNNIPATYNLAVSQQYGYGTDKDIDLAIANYQEAADGGSMRAIFKLGEVFFRGEDVETNYELSESYLRMLPSHYSDNVDYMLGSILLDQENTHEAEEYFLASAQNGFVPSMIALANAYKNGDIAEQNDEEALKWYIAAAEAGNVEAQYMAGKLFSDR